MRAEQVYADESVSRSPAETSKYALNQIIVNSIVAFPPHQTEYLQRHDLSN
jgi:hypothetical protein